MTMSTIEMPESKAHLFEESEEKLEHGAYNIPIVANHASIDALMPPHFLFQMTIANKHPVKVSHVLI